MRPWQALDGRAVGEAVADEAEVALGVEALAVEGDDAGRLLAAMLQGVQAERRDRGGVGVAEDAEDAAFLAQRVAVEVEVVGRRVSACRGLRSVLIMRLVLGARGCRSARMPLM